MKIPKGKSKSTKDKIAEYIASISQEDEGKFKEKILDYIKGRQEIIEKFLEKGKSNIEGSKYTLHVLRKWNSYTPVLPSSKDTFSNKGGGYFLHIDGYGVVIDPGYNFIENFIRAGFKLDDIDSIFISHAHNDHTVELESIFSLLFQRNKDQSGPDVKQIYLYINLGTFKKFAGYFDLSKPAQNYYIKDIIILNKHQAVNVTPKIKVMVTNVRHHEMISENFAVGFIFEVTGEEGRIRSIKFTCDTGWDTAIQKENKKIAEEQLLADSVGINNGDVDILVAHIGSIKSIEFDYDTTKSLIENEKNDKLYKYHLGMIGVVAAIDFWKPQITLVSEFGQEMNAIRMILLRY